MKRILFFTAFFCLFAPQISAQEQASASKEKGTAAVTQPAYGEKLHLAGIHNAGKIGANLYRGAQPKAAGLAELKKLGITTIVDLRGDDRAKVDWENREATALGMRFVHIPVSGWSPPADAQVAQFLALFRDEPQQIVFVHCRFGDDRTGVFVATYRMAVGKWSPERAMGEMYFFGFNGFWHPAMKQYIREFPSRLKSGPALASFEPRPATP